MSRVTVLLQVLFYHWVILTTLCYFFATANNTKTKQLTLCVQQSKNPRSLIYVSTLDGKISALDAAGQKQWSLDFNDGPMLSSNIHSRELNDNGQWVRLIPSLNGGLYKFDGENLEMLPITTDQLLYSSFRYSNDLVFSGGKEICSYGVHTGTGKILYECNSHGCTNNTENKGYLKHEVLVIKRLQQTVRAIEARTGIERWNFSVGQHDLVLMSPEETYCPDKADLLNVQISAIIPEGLIWAVNESDPTYKLWQYKFDSPIVSIWRENANRDSEDQDLLEEISLFNSSQWIWGPEYSTSSPGLYVGMHERQLYVQENSKLKTSLDSYKHVQPAVYPWQPYPAKGTAIINTLSDKNDKHEVSAAINEVQCTTALSVLYNSEYVNGNGFYLYSKNEVESTITEQCNGSQLASNKEKPKINYMEYENNKPRKIISTFILNTWQTILAVSIIILLRYMLPFNLKDVKDAFIPPVIIERPISIVETKSNDTANDENENFTSRYLTDFEPVDCLGKGGYGVVFEARNKLDGRHYAIKRIALQNNEQSRERVMREVRALAKLEHCNIVRYFNSWLESPPCEWQEKHDEQWAIKLSSSGCPSAITETETKPDVRINVSQTDSPSAEDALEVYKLNQTEMTNDSVIVFEHSSEKQREDDAVYIGDSSSSDSSDVPPSNDVTENGLDGWNSARVINDSLKLSIDNSNHSESIIFEESDNNITEEADNDIEEETENNSTRNKESRDRRKSELSLDLTAKSSNRKSTKMFLYIQTQLCQRLSLKEWLKQESSVRDPARVLSIFQQIVDAVEYVHLQGLIHRDLKPSNIFFAFDNIIKVGDFGLVTAMTEGWDGTRTPVSENETVTLIDSIHTACVGTHLYMSPEQANGKAYNYKVDIYSLGIILFELLTPFSTDMERAIVLTDLRKSIFPSYFAEKHPAEYDLLKMMLDNDPANRPTTSGIKAKPPLLNYQAANEFNVDKDSKSHFELPQQTGHSSITISSK